MPSYRRAARCAQITNWREEPLLWATSAPVAGAGLTWLELRDLHEQTGPVPILLAYLHGGAEGRPWDSGEQAGRAADVLAPPSRSGAP